MKRVVDCFAPERKNKDWKLDVAPHVSPAAIEKHSLSKLLLMQAEALRSVQFEEQYMVKPMKSAQIQSAYGWPEAYVAQACWRKGQTFAVGAVMHSADHSTLFEITSCLSDGVTPYRLVAKFRHVPIICLPSVVFSLYRSGMHFAS